jgi:hypothetical protein
MGRDDDPHVPGGTMTTFGNRPNGTPLVGHVRNGVVGTAYDADDVVANVAVRVDKPRAGDIEHDSDELSRDSEGGRRMPERALRECEPLVQNA